MQPDSPFDLGQKMLCRIVLCSSKLVKGSPAFMPDSKLVEQVTQHTQV